MLGPCNSEQFKTMTSKGLLTDLDITKLCIDTDTPMITPFQEKLSDKGKISYGLSSCGYDARAGTSFKIFTNVNNSIIDPKDFSEDCFVEREADYCIIPPNSFILCHTVEHFNMPEDVMGICLGKSTYARCGNVCGVTPLEPGWSGQVTIEISNTTTLPAKVYANEGVCQFLFFRTQNPCLTPYNKRNGKYMGQKGVVLPKVIT